MGKGRKRKAGKREPNGRLSRNPAAVAARNLDALDQEQRDTISVGLEARERVHKVEAKHSRDQLAGSFAGRLCLTKQISRSQYDASVTWLEDRANYLLAIAPAVGREPGAVDLNATKGRSGYENVNWSQRCVSRYKAAIEALQAKQNEVRNTATIYAALDYTVNRDVELYHLVPDLRLALNALVRFYGLVDAREAA